MTEFRYFSLAEADSAQGTTVVIDVLRAFTTAAYAFHGGARRIYPVAGVEEVLHLKSQLDDALTMGEVDGFKPEGFDFGNSPAVIRNVDLQNRILVQRTSAGTQGLIRAKQADQLLAASFVVAKATATYLRSLQPDLISFVVTGVCPGRDGDEDRACGDYIEAMVRGKDPDPQDYTKRVATSTIGKSFYEDKVAYLLQEDYELSIWADIFNFYMPIRIEDDLLVLENSEI